MTNSAGTFATETSPIINRAVHWAWTFVVVGFSVASVGVTIAGFTKGGFSLAGLSELGSYLQGTVASIWSLAGLLFIYATFLAQREQMAHQEMELADWVCFERVDKEIGSFS